MTFFAKTKRNQVTLEEVTGLLNGLKIPISLVFTPTNLESEKKKFFDSDTYNPQFKYSIVKNQNSRILKELKAITEITDVDPRISDFYLQLINDKDQINNLMSSVGDNKKVTSISLERYKTPSPILFRNACRILRGYLNGYKVLDWDKYKGQRKMEYDEIEEVFKVVFEEFGLSDWDVERSKKITQDGIKTGVKAKRVFLDPGITKRAISLKKTIIHEIGTHVIRAENGYNSGLYALGKANIADYIDVEEGLAMYNEETMGVLKDKDLKLRAAMVWAIKVGQNMSFRELHNALLAFKQKKAAFEIAYRVKRGLGDTSIPGIYSKDVAYFRGFRRVRKKLANDSSLYKILYAGKISFKQIKWVEEGLIKKPKIVPSKEMFNEIFKIAGID